MDEHTTKANVRIHWPGLRLPVTVLLDDPAPCRNPAWYEFPEQGNVAVVPNSFTEEFADLVDRTGAAGKFSVVPCPGAQGRIDEGMPGISDEEMAGFLRLVRERIAPRWDISPEMLTHNKALDLATMQPLPEREDVWAARQDERILTPYIARWSRTASPRPGPSGRRWKRSTRGRSRPRCARSAACAWAGTSCTWTPTRRSCRPA